MTFGVYKGITVSLCHDSRNDEGIYGFPFVCTPKYDTREKYLDFLSCKVEDGFQSKYLDLDFIVLDGDIPDILPRSPRQLIDSFKKICKKKLAMRKIRSISRTRKIHEELVAAVYHPRRIERYLEMGLSLDEICEL
jgi:hypothetical protein